MIAAVVLLAAASRLLPLDDGRPVLIDGRSISLIDAHGAKTPVPAGSYMTRTRELLVVAPDGNVVRSVRRNDGGDPRVASPDIAATKRAASDAAILDAVRKKLDAFAAQNHVWFRPFAIDRGALTLKMMFCSEACPVGIDTQAKTALGSVPGVKSVTGPLATTLCYGGFNAAAGDCGP